MGSLIDIAGERFGRLTVIEIAHRRGLNSGGTVVYWKCRCDCGEMKIVKSQSLRTGVTKSCGCLARENFPRIPVKHGMSKSKTYGSWRAMRERCLDPKNKRFANYGGRGISVCERWSQFHNFLSDMGERPEGHTIERIDVNRGYEPGNCMWIPSSKQCENTTRNRVIEYNGKKRILRDWAKLIGVTPRALAIRLSKYPVPVAMNLSRYQKGV